MEPIDGRKLKMTPAWAAALKAAPTPVEYRDTVQPGLILRVEVSGRKTWVCRYVFRGRERRYTIGAFPDVKLKGAREDARRKRGQASLGTDPQIERERARIGDTVDAAVTSWLEDTKQGAGSRWKDGLEGGSARSFLPHVRRLQRDLGHRLLSDVNARDVERFVSAPEAAATRNRALTALRGFVAWAKRKGLIETDPTATLVKERETERARVLTEDELRALVHGYDVTRYGPVVRLLALTGLRRDEVLGAKWAWFDEPAGVLTIPAAAEKTGRSRGEPRRVALSSHAVVLLKEQRARLFAEGLRASEYIFATTSGERPHRDALKPILYGLRGMRSNGQPASKDKRAKARPVLLPDDATLHDVRRTVADALLNKLHAAPWVVDHVVLGHARPKMLRTYMPTLPLEEARKALSLWAAELDRIINGAAQEEQA